MDEEFEEEKVWAVAWEKNDDSPMNRKQKVASFSLQSASKNRQRLNFVGEQSRQSAPVSTPNLSKCKINCEEEDEEEGDLAPHEWLARKMEKSQISSSVCEGVGRTLKGRDQRKLRDAVLTKTGFLE